MSIVYPKDYRDGGEFRGWWRVDAQFGIHRIPMEEKERHTASRDCFCIPIDDTAGWTIATHGSWRSSYTHRVMRFGRKPGEP